VLYLFLTFTRSFIIYFILQVSVTNMHKRMVQQVLRAKILFFDSNPLGRIITRFSKDVTQLDLVMPNIAVLCSFGLFRAITVVMVIGYVHFYILPVLGIIMFIMFMVVKKSRNVMRES
jgi:ABC-type multidrug transport system fused ATPase/permease subunit